MSAQNLNLCTRLHITLTDSCIEQQTWHTYTENQIYQIPEQNHELHMLLHITLDHTFLSNIYNSITRRKISGTRKLAELLNTTVQKDL